MKYNVLMNYSNRLLLQSKLHHREVVKDTKHGKVAVGCTPCPNNTVKLAGNERDCRKGTSKPCSQQQFVIKEQGYQVQ